MTKHLPGERLLFDKRVECHSLMTTMSVSSYLALVQNAYRNRGGISFQREALKTTTAKRIRSRMVEDIKRGTVLPPVVIGVIGNEALFDLMVKEDVDAIVAHVMRLENISIIDGMQRTTALVEALAEEGAVGKGDIRVECWVARSTESLIYRMLVLNTGQVPWNLKRQLQVVYQPLIEEISRRVKIERLFTVANVGKRTKGGEYAADDLVEAFIAFGLRKTDIDTQETLADEFSRLDVVEAISTHKYEYFFYDCLQIMVNIDKAFSRYKSDDGDAADEKSRERFTKGRNIFDSQPARIGFMVALAIYVLGRVGMDKDAETSLALLSAVKAASDVFVHRVEAMSLPELGDFLQLDMLCDVLPKNTAKVGRHERSFFEAAFKVLFAEKFAVPSMEACWRS